MNDVLVLNHSYYAIGFTSWQRAVGMLYLDRARVVDEEYRTYSFQNWCEISEFIKDHPSGYIHAANITIAMPEIIALLFYDRLPVNEVRFTRKNIYQHYGHRCCYCGKKFPPSELNLDHIIPRSRGGKTTWNNIVTACISCNLRKGNLLPDESGLKLLVTPTRPKWNNNLTFSLSPVTKFKTSWQKFIDSAYWNVELEE